MKQLPNLLSAGRLAVAPYVFYLLAAREYRAVLIWFGIAGLSDALDGWLARRFDAQSALGEMLDPVADKVLLSGSFLILALTGGAPVWLAALVMGRDAAILLFALWGLLFTKTRRSFPASGWGKLSTAAQIVFVVAAVAQLAGYVDRRVVLVLVGLTAALTAWSGLDYARRALAQRVI